MAKSVTQKRWLKMRNKIQWLDKQSWIVDFFMPDIFNSVVTDTYCAPKGSIYYNTM